MKTLQCLTAAAALVLACGSAPAQPGPAASGPGASAPYGGPGGMRGGMRHGMGGRWGADFTHGWSLMTAEERKEHQTKMHAAKTYEECVAYRDQHHQMMLTRAKEKNASVPAQPRHDACADLKR